MNQTYSVLSTRNPAFGAFAFSHAVLVTALVYVALVPLERAFAMHLIIEPLAFIRRPRRPFLDTEAIFLVDLEHAVINIAVCSGISSSAVLVSIVPLSLELLKTYFILVAVRVGLDANALSLVGFVLSFKHIARSPAEFPHTFFLVVHPVTFVPVSIFPGVPALAVSLVLLDVSLVGTVFVLERVPAVGNAALDALGNILGPRLGPIGVSASIDSRRLLGVRSACIRFSNSRLMLFGSLRDSRG
jgi:hypothetical protein